MLGIGGSAAKTDRGQQLAGYGDLTNIFNTGLSQGNSTLGQGQADTGQAAQYWSKLLNGDRSSVMQALSPEISGITGQANQNRKQQAAMGTARGGGTDALNQQQQQNTQAQVSNLVNSARPQAAQQMQAIGSQEQNTGSNLLGLGANAAGSLTSDAAQSYGGQYGTNAQNRNTGAALGQLAGAFFGL